MNKGNVSHELGFSLIEIIIAIAIMAIVGGIIAPNFVRYTNTNRITACETDREAILAVFERCIYGQTKELTTADLDAVLRGMDVKTKEEVLPYVSCPSNGSYTAEVIGDVAIIHCDCAQHEDVAIDFVGWDGTESMEDTEDATLDPPPDDPDDDSDDPEDPDDPDDPDDPEEPTPVITGYWPYAEDARWEGKKSPGQYVEILVPSGIFTSRDGNTYVIVDKNGGNGRFRVYWEWNLGPENVDARGLGQCIAWSGILIEDIESVRYKQLQTDGTYVSTDMLTGIHYGDIVVYKDKRYICTSQGDSLQIPLPVEGQNSDYYKLVE